MSRFSTIFYPPSVACLAWFAVYPAPKSIAQTYAPPAAGDYGGAGPDSVSIDTLINPKYPTANGEPLDISIYHPGTSINSSLPTIFFANGFTSPVGDPADYDTLLTNLTSQGYNVVFSPHEGGSSLNIPKRFYKLTTEFDAVVSTYHHRS